jgi:hypothetical protein
VLIHHTEHQQLAGKDHHANGARRLMGTTRMLASANTTLTVTLWNAKTPTCTLAAKIKRAVN